MGTKRRQMGRRESFYQPGGDGPLHQLNIEKDSYVHVVSVNLRRDSDDRINEQLHNVAGHSWRSGTRCALHSILGGPGGMAPSDIAHFVYICKEKMNPLERAEHKLEKKASKKAY